MPVASDWLIMMVRSLQISCFIVFNNLVEMPSLPQLGLGFKLSNMFMVVPSYIFWNVKLFNIGLCR